MFSVKCRFRREIKNQTESPQFFPCEISDRAIPTLSCSASATIEPPFPPHFHFLLLQKEFGAILSVP